MLILVTGTPGAGKTLFTLDRLVKEFTDRKNPDKPQRPIFVNGIPDLDYRYFKARELEDPDFWFDCPDGSVIVIDEGQRIFPQRPAGRDVPKKCREFETHRHRGQDVIVTTQDATTLDVHLRKLCGRHYHIKRTLGQEVATVYEYDRYMSDPLDWHSKKEAISAGPWKFPKRLYERYKSAALHTVKKRYPFKLFLIPIALVLCVGFIWFGVSSLMGKADEITAAAEPADTREVVRGTVVDVLPGNSLSYTRIHEPLIPELQHTALFYQSEYQANTFPKPHCVIYETSKDWPGVTQCKCYTQQITTYQASQKLCRYWARNGFFDPTKSDDDLYERGAGTNASVPAPAPANPLESSVRRY